ncbi:MAG: hypothetical protein MJ236_02645 [Clostridia bacterium]|nr:hypothetical protein [Clostridia bacterium]
MTDIHTHILPGIDDGAKDVGMSIAMLKEMKKQGVDIVYATPHYYPTETVDEFLKRRNTAYNTLMTALNDIDKSQVPEVRLGAEVYYNHFLLKNPDFKKLTYQDWNCVLLEMPWERWNDQVLDDVEVLGRAFGVEIVLAHLERYYDMTDKKHLKRVLKFGYHVQMNAEYLVNEKTRKNALKLYKKNKVEFVASDAHNMHHRRPNLGEAMSILEENRK